MKEPKWHFPMSIEEAFKLNKDEGAFFHAGGTGLLMGKLAGIKSFIDLSKLDLATINKGKKIVEIGAMVTFSKLADTFGKDCLLGLVADKTLPPALANSVTLGGNLAMFPLRSDMACPLLALNSEVLLFDGEKKYIKLSDYLSNGKMRNKSLLLGIRFERHDFLKFHHREIRTEFDYNAFAITMLATKEGDEIIDSRIVITGTKDGFNRFEDLEVKINGRGFKDINSTKLSQTVNLEFIDKAHGSKEYLAEIARIQIERGIEILKEGIK